MERVVPVLVLVLAAACSPTPNTAAPSATASALEGQWDYAGTLKGQASIVDGRFVFLFGAPEDTASMIANAGTYTVSQDTATGRVLFSTVKANVGLRFRWTITGWSADTASYVVLNDSGRVTDHGRAVKRRT